MQDHFEQILTMLSEIKVEQAANWTETKVRLANIDEHFQKLNGSVARHEQSINELRLHPMTCPMNPRMDAVEDKLVAADEKTKQDDKWYGRLRPIIAWASLLSFSLMFLLTLVHAEEMLKYFKIIR